MMRNNGFIYGLTLLLFLLCSCKKFLETKSVQTLSTPDNLNDLQTILNNPAMMKSLALVNNGSDEFYVVYTDWLSEPQLHRKMMYVWDAELDYLNDWRGLYKPVYLANTVLDNLDKINEPGQQTRKENIRGAALFLRSYCFYLFAQQYALQYDPATAKTDMGIVLRLNGDFNEESVRSSIQESYDQIIKDLEEAVKILPVTTFYKFNPDKAAGYALLSRTYLQIGNYSKARENADACLQLTKALIDYNTLTFSSEFTFGDYRKNPEILFYANNSDCINVDRIRAKIDTVLYQSFVEDDLRKKVFFKLNADKSYAFKGNYTGDVSLFNGVAVDEVYLIRAECNARLGNVSAAMQDLNDLLIKRWTAGKFSPFTASTPDDALNIILRERKKELIFRGTRWSDLKRLNKDPKFAVTLKRKLNGVVYELPPNDLRYAVFIPLEIMNITNLKQNSR